MSLNISPTYSSTYKFVPGKNLNTDEFWGGTYYPAQSSSNYQSISIQFNATVPFINDNRYYWNNHYAIIKSSVATTTFTTSYGTYNATLIGTYNGNYYYMSDNSTTWSNQLNRFRTTS